MFAHYLLLLMTTSKRKESVGVASPMSLHIFHLSQWVYSQKAKLLYLDLVAADLNSFAAKQNTKWVIFCGERQEHVKQLLAVQVASQIFSSNQPTRLEVHQPFPSMISFGLFRKSS